MNAKFALALILALQVSVSLCELPTPSEELVNKYDELKTTFFKRLFNLYQNAQSAAAPVVDQVGGSEQGKVVKDYIEEVQGKPELETFVKVATGVGQELKPMIDKTRSAALGWYELYFRPSIGEYLSDAIDNIKIHLDRYMPAE